MENHVLYQMLNIARTDTFQYIYSDLYTMMLFKLLPCGKI